MYSTHLDARLQSQLSTETLRAFELEGAFQEKEGDIPADRVVLDALLQRFDDQVEEQGSACSLCKGFVATLAKIGTISNKMDATPAEKDASNKKRNERNNVVDSMRKHLNDSNAAEAHRGLRLDGWWTKWPQRAQDHIAPSFVQRGFLKTTEFDDTPYHMHPSQLCSGPGEPPLFPSQSRVDHTWLAEHGAPKKGDLIVLRCGAEGSAGRNREPFGIGIIKKLVQRRVCEETSDHGLALAPARPVHPRLFGGDYDDALLQRYRCWRAQFLLRERPFEIRMSRHVDTEIGEPTQLGAFATRFIPKGSQIDWCAGCMCADSALPAGERSHARAVPGTPRLVVDGLPVAQLFTRYVARSDDELLAMRNLPASAFHPRVQHSDPAVLRRFEELPLGGLFNAASPGSRRLYNVGLARLSTHAQCAHAMFPTHFASADILVGQELLTCYNNSEQSYGFRDGHFMADVDEPLDSALETSSPAATVPTAGTEVAVQADAVGHPPVRLRRAAAAAARSSLRATMASDPTQDLAPVRESGASAARKRARRAGNSSDSVDDDHAPLSSFVSAPGAAASGAKRPRYDEEMQQSGTSDSAADDLDSDPDFDGGIATAARSRNSRPKANSAMEVWEAAATPLRTEFGKRHHRDKQLSVLHMGELPHVLIEWYDLEDRDVTRLRFDDDEHWNSRFANEEAEAAKIGASASRSSEASGASASSAEFEPVPAWLVNEYQNVHFLPKPSKEQGKQESRIFAPGTFVLWGEPKMILKSDHTLTKAAFTRILRDLTGSDSKPGEARNAGLIARASHARALPRAKAAPAPAAAAAAAPAARSRQRNIARR